MAFWEAVGVGAGLGFSLAAPPGPVLAKLAFETAKGRRVPGFLVGVGAMSADAVFFTLVYFGLVALLPPDRILGALAFVGVAVMAYFAFGAWRAARRPLETPRSRLNGWPAGFLLAGTSPFNFAWWVTAGAPYVERYGPALALGFFPMLLVVVIASIALISLGRHVQGFETYVAYASAFLLAVFAGVLAYNGVEFLTR